MLRKRKIFYGWWMALASASLNFFAGGGFFYGFTVFFNPIREALHLTATTTSLAFVFQRLENGIAGPIVGFLADRIAPRKLMLPGWAVVGLGFLLMSRINSLWAFFGAFLIIGIGLSFGSFVVVNTAIANWFTKKRSLAMTMIYVGYGVGGLVVPLLALAIGRLGWRETMTILGILAWVIGLPLSLLMRHKPGQYGYLPDGETKAIVNPPGMVKSDSSQATLGPELGSPAAGFTTKGALKTRAFWLLSAVLLIQQITTSSVIVHIAPYLESVGFPTARAALAVTGMALCSLIGRLGLGMLGDFVNKRYLIAIALALQTIGILIFSFVDTGREWLIIPFLLTFAPGYGGPVPLRAALQADYFGTKNFGTIMGVMSLVTMVGGLTSPVVAGWIFDVKGSYHLAWQLFTLVTALAIPLILLAKPPKGSTSAVT